MSDYVLELEQPEPVIRLVSIRRLPEIVTVVHPDGQVYVVKQHFLSDFLSKKERDIGREEGYAENKIEASSAEKNSLRALKVIDQRSPKVALLKLEWACALAGKGPDLALEIRACALWEGPSCILGRSAIRQAAADDDSDSDAEEEEQKDHFYGLTKEQASQGVLGVHTSAFQAYLTDPDNVDVDIRTQSPRTADNIIGNVRCVGVNYLGFMFLFCFLCRNGIV